MRESPFGFSYSWADLAPIRPLTVTVFVAQILGAAGGLLFSSSPDNLARIWAGGALATFPGFLVGLLVQWKIRAEALSENATMVRRLGLIALLLSLAAAAMPPKPK
jgi:hypothetical protein